MFHFVLQFIQVVCFLLIDPDTSRSSQDDVLVPCMFAICLGILHTHITAAHGALNSGSSVGHDHLDAKSSSLYHHFSVYPRTAEHQVCNVFDTSPATIRLDVTAQPPTDESCLHVRSGVGDVKRLSAASEHVSDLGELDLCLSEQLSIPSCHSVLPADKHPSRATDQVVTAVLPADLSIHVNQSVAREEVHLDNRCAESDFLPSHPICKSRRRGSMDANVLCVTDHSGSSDWSTLNEQDEGAISPAITAGKTLSRQVEFLTSHSLGRILHENGSSRQLINSRGNDADLKKDDSDVHVIQPTADLPETNSPQQIQLANARDDGYVSALSQPLAHDVFSSVTTLPHYHSLFDNLVTDSSVPKSISVNSVNSSMSVVLPTYPSIDQNALLTTQVCDHQHPLLGTCVSVAGVIASQLDSSSSLVCEPEKSIATNTSNMSCPRPKTEQRPGQSITPSTCQSLRKRCWSVSIPIDLTLGNVPSGFYPLATLSALNCLMPSPNVEHARFCLSLISMKGSAKSNSMARFIPPCLRTFLPGAFDFATSDRIATPWLRPSPSVAGECLTGIGGPFPWLWTGVIASQLDSSSSLVCEPEKSIATNTSNMSCPRPKTEQRPGQSITPSTCQSLRKRCWSVSIPIDLTLGNVPSGFYPLATLSALNCLMPSPNVEHARFCLSLISMKGSAKSNSMARFIPPCLRTFLPGAFDFATSDRIATPWLRPSPSVAGECLKRPSACWFHSSSMALSPGASSVSDVSRSENSAPADAVRPARLLNLESVHDIGVGLDANPNSLVLPSPSEQKSFDSLVKLPTDSAFSVNDPSVMPIHGYSSCPSSGQVSRCVS
ncbi:hypothetical protein AHF37_02866 [Paragonimus kellicotti]|nr:hypothetical protein AHF37_02866 [Paragonimus kellicotti]